MLLRSLLAVIVAVFVLPSMLHAQRFHNNGARQNVVQRWNRGMGIWHGAGRHWQTPGHESSYYNAWSAHNSALVTRGHYPQNFDYHLPVQNFYQPDPFYTPTPKQPQKPTAAPLGGSYEKFGDEDVDEEVPEIEPVDGEPANKEDRDAKSLQESDEQSSGPSINTNYDLPNDAFIYSSQSKTAEKWEKIK